MFGEIATKRFESQSGRRRYAKIPQKHIFAAHFVFIKKKQYRLARTKVSLTKIKINVKILR